MRKLLDAIWEPFDSSDSVEWFLLLFGYTVLIIMLVGAIWT
jgi:hypothetical protein